MDGSAELGRGWDLVFSGRFRDSLVPFGQAAHDYRWAAEALYGMGVARLSLHDDVHAEAALWDSLQRAPQNADAVFYLGLIAERRGRRQEATSRYREALAIAPDHPSARARLAALASGASVRPSIVPLPPSRPSPPPPRPRPAPARPPVPAAPPDEVEQVVASVDLVARPRPLAYLTSLDKEVLAPLPVDIATGAVLVAFCAALFLARASLPFLGSFITALQVAAGAGAVLELLGLALTAVRASRVRVTIRRGTLTVEGDLLKPGVVSVALADVEHLYLRRAGLHAITGDGTLVFVTAEATTLVTGIARGERLAHLYRQLLEVVASLRG